jgi:predicted ABC-type ATPase
VIIAGPNGSGKSTVAAGLLPDGMTFVNADLIASELSGVKGTPGDIKAGRHLLHQVQQLEEGGTDFAFETTLAMRGLTTRIRAWNELDYQVHLFYFWLPHPDMCVMRVEGRVKDGGHPVPEETIRRRYDAGLKLFFTTYMHLVDKWRMYDNSNLDEPKLIAKGGMTQPTTVVRPEIWDELLLRNSNG